MTTPSKRSRGHYLVRRRNRSAKAFYSRVFTCEIAWEDALSAVPKFGAVMINLLEVSEALHLLNHCALLRLRRGRGRY